MPAEHLHDISRLQTMFHWLLDTWEAAVLLTGIFFSWSIWWLRNVFVTNRRMQEYVELNTKQHQKLERDVHSIRENVSWLKGFLEQHYGDDDG